MKILVTGAAGYIGSHTTLLLLEAGHDVVALDNLANSKYESLRRVQEITQKSISFRQIDLLDDFSLDEIFARENFDAVLHFAGLKAVGESFVEPLRYYQNNVAGTLNLVQSMAKHGVYKLVFSSSATVYGASGTVPLVENSPMAAVNPYGRTKIQVEEILGDLSAADPRWSIALLRYFNPAGAHPSGLIGEDPEGAPNNLVPFVAQVAVGQRPRVVVFGADYETDDGTGVRDYIHVMDLAEGHIAALGHLMTSTGAYRWNLGTGRGASVLEVIDEFSKAAGKTIVYEIAPRRQGDVAVSYADPSAARADLGWSAERDLKQMCQDHWRWQRTNPQGY
ncbi:UDP-glucose 4-epimerase GalE [Pseudarthrobacter sp. TAF60_1]|uniref:UDP-glucose 4-epimerase GalE n=1 Tax=Pseudarthrobacter sp. TAF60_1 TaxID=3233071 RepID=UPI003F98D7C4